MNTNTMLNVYTPVIRVNGVETTLTVASPVVDFEVHNIGTKGFVREYLRRETGASSVRVGNRVRVITQTQATKEGILVLAATKANIKLAKGVRVQRQIEREERRSQPTEPTETQVIRAWAKANGHKVADRGRLPKRVVRAYNRAHGKKANTTEATVSVAALKKLKKSELVDLLATLVND